MCYKNHSKREKVTYLLTSSRREVWLPLSLPPESKNCLSLTLFMILLVFQYFIPISLAPVHLCIYEYDGETHFHQLSHYCNSRRNTPNLVLLLKEPTRQRNFPAAFFQHGILVFT